MTDITPGLQQAALYWPQRQGASYSRSRRSPAPGEPFPVPPPGLRAYYGTSDESYLASGAEDSKEMREILAGSGFQAEDAGRILDLGCAGGRMIRHLADLAPRTEIWGCDIWADAIAWCQENLSPPFRFAVTTVAPHLPFEDRSFGLVYCGSLFTHIDDLAEAWFLELHRIIRPGGRLLFSVNDRHAAAIFDGLGDPAFYPRFHERTGGRRNWDEFVALVHAEPEYERFRAGDTWMMSWGRRQLPHVFWDADVLCERLAYDWRRCSVNPESYGHQTVVLLERA